MADRFAQGRGGGGRDVERGSNWRPAAGYGREPQFDMHDQGYQARPRPPFRNFSGNQFQNHFGRDGYGNWNHEGSGRDTRQFQHRPLAQINLPPAVSKYQQKTNVVTSSGGGGGNEAQTSRANSAGAVLTGTEGSVGIPESKLPATEKIIFHKCGEKGHSSKGCEAIVKCSICTKDTHIAEFCAWLHQKKPEAALVGFGGEGLGIFVAEHAKDLVGSSKNDVVALLRLREGCDIEIDSDDLIRSLAKTYP
ncbi:hypothetical protein VPH35_061625 [Triticum aestivum]